MPSSARQSIFDDYSRDEFTDALLLASKRRHMNNVATLAPGLFRRQRLYSFRSASAPRLTAPRHKRYHKKSH